MSRFYDFMLFKISFFLYNFSVECGKIKKSVNEFIALNSLKFNVLNKNQE